MNSDKMNKLTRSLKKYLALTCAVGTVAFASFAQAAPAEEAKPGMIKAEELAELYKSDGYKHTSTRYGYSISCPKKPNVIPLSLVYEGAKGEFLCFENEGYVFKTAWIVMVDAFDDDFMPEHMEKLSDAAKQKIGEKLLASSPYETVDPVDLGFTHGMRAITAKNFISYEDGEGKPGVEVEVDGREIRTYFRGQFGGKFLVALHQLPDVTDEQELQYYAGLLTFQEWPSTAEDKKGEAKVKNRDASKKK